MLRFHVPLIEPDVRVSRIRLAALSGAEGRTRVHAFAHGPVAAGCKSGYTLRVCWGWFAAVDMRCRHDRPADPSNLISDGPCGTGLKPVALVCNRWNLEPTA